MPRAIRIASLGLGALGLALGGGLWAAAGVIALVRPGHGITAGYGRDRGALVNLRADADGTLWIQHFPKNLSTRLGPYVGATRSERELAGLAGASPWRAVWPRTRSDPTCWRLYWHVGPALAVSTVLVVLAVVPRRLRRWRRRRSGLCLNCGYDLRGAVSDICTECGHPGTGKVGNAPRP